MTILKMLTRILAIVGAELVSVLRRPGALISLILGPFLIMALFGAGYSGFRRPLDTIVVIPEGSGLPTDVGLYATLAGEAMNIVEVTADESSAAARLAGEAVDIVLVAPTDAEERFRNGEQTVIDVRVNAIDPVEQGYAIFLARGLEAAVNRQIIERVAREGTGYAVAEGVDEAKAIPPEVIAAPTRTQVLNVAPSAPTVVQYFGPAVLALILQHMAVSLIALSLVRERTSGLFELFRVSPISTAELVVGKLIAFGLFSGLVALLTIAFVVVGLGVPVLADPIWVALAVGLLIVASLGVGLLIAAVSSTEAQAVQLSLLVLLASVFFSGFALAIEEFREPVRGALHAIPATNGIRLLTDFLFRGTTVALWQLALLGGLALGYVFLGWVLLRRVLARA